MSTQEDKKRIFPLPGDGGYASPEESGDFRKIEEAEDADDDTDDVNFMDMPGNAPADGDENYQDEEEKRSRQDYRNDDMIEETRQ